MAVQALDLIEIRILIASFLDLKTLKICIRVCSSWHTSLLPFLFRNVSLHQACPLPPISLFQANAHHIRRLTFIGARHADSLLKLRGCTSLSALAIKGVYQELSQPVWQSLTDFVVAHADTLQELTLDHCAAGNHLIFWDTLSELAPMEDDLFRAMDPGSCPLHRKRLALQTLIVSDHTILDSAQPAFRRVIQCLEAIFVQNYTAPPKFMDPVLSPASFPPLMLWQLRRAEFSYGAEEFIFSLMQQTPNLEELYVRNLYYRAQPVSLSAGVTFGELYWPHMRVVQLVGCQDELLRRLVRNTKSLTHLDVRRSGFKRSILAELMGGLSIPFSSSQLNRTLLEIRARLETLRLLHLDFCNGADSSMIQHFLSSCPNLESISADAISTLDVAAEAAAQNSLGTMTWVCKGLKVFKMNVEIDVSSDRRTGPSRRNITPSDQRLAFYKHLGSLHELEVAHLNRNGGEREHRAPRNSIYIRLTMGLEELNELRQLREFVVKDQGFECKEDEINWMVQHWPRLERIAGFLFGGWATLREKGVKHDILHGGRRRGFVYKIHTPFTL